MTHFRLIFSLLCLYAVPAQAQKVLLIADDDPAGTAVLGAALTGAGMTVTQTAVPSWQYNGMNPATAGFDVIVLLAGTANSQTNDMPAAGQTAVLGFVNAGGGLINTEWSAYHVAAGRWQTLKPLVLLQRTGGTIGTIDYNVGMGFSTHPIWAGLPMSFSVSSASNVGLVIPGPGVVRIATSTAAGDGLVIRDLINNGRIVQVSTAGNYTNGTWTNANLKTLAINSVKWASKSRVLLPPVASAGGPYVVDEGGMVTLSGVCTDPQMAQLTYSWDFQGNNLYADATGPMPVYSAAGLTGPLKLAIGLKCTNTGNLSTTAATMIMVRDVAPVFTSTPPLSAMEGTPYLYNAMTFDPGANDMLMCKVVAGPMGMSVTAATCKVQWLPTFDQARANKQKVTISVTDKNGSTGTQSFTIAVSFIDMDMDGLPDTWEKLYFGNLMQGPGDDPDKDGRPNLKEYQDGTDPTKYDGPSAPTAMSPDKGANVPTMATLVIGNGIEPGGEPLIYEFQVYSDAGLNNLVDVNLNVPAGMGTTSWITAMLLEDHHYWWRARARDPYISGAWSAVATFFANDVHEPPTAPGISMPLDQTKVKLAKPTLEVTNAKSSDELSLTYTFEVYPSSDMTDKSKATEIGTGIVEGMGGITSYTVMSSLNAYQHYYWRVQATDSLNLAGAWSKTPSFQVVPTNSPPSPPTIAAPKEGDRLTTLAPVVMLGGSVDPDDEKPIQYLCDLDVGVGFDSPMKQTSMPLLPADQMVNTVTWTPAPLAPTQHYCLRCRGFDPSGTSGWTQVCFLIDPVNQPPSVPVLQNPSDGGMAAGDVVRFTWANSIDPEGDAIEYDIEVFTDAALTMRVAQGKGEDGPTGRTLVGLPSGALLWRARAVDSLGATSEWSKPNAFNDSAAGPTMTTASGCGCHVGAPPTHTSFAYFLVAAAAFASVRRLRRRLRVES